MAAPKAKNKSVSTPTTPRQPVIRGRFAPSPTGQLHFGSLLAAVGSCLQARTRGGQWLLRIEDIDPPREVPGAARHQIETLKMFGLIPDRPVQWQSHFDARHRAALAVLLESGQAFPCACSRSDLPPDGIYPGECREGVPAGKRARSVRLKVSNVDVCFDDLVQGQCCQNPGRQTGDFVVLRADGLIAYQLAVVVDDAAAGITEVVRGSDLIESTARQMHVYRCLGESPPIYAHLPLVVDESGRKLSKSAADDPIHVYPPATALRLVLRALGHEPPRHCRTLDSLWRWALGHWEIGRVPRGPICFGVPPSGW